MHNTEEKLASFEKLLNIMDQLREQCPWDKKQTFETLRNLTIEETYELADAVIENNLNELKKELGDLLLHIVFYAKIGSETNTFDIKDVTDGIIEKLIHRHPHIFGDVKVADAEEVKRNWEQLKMKEGKKSVLEGVPSSLPSLIKAKRIQEKVRGVGFDWDKREQVWDKVSEEVNELKAEVLKGDNSKIESEFGDVLFSIINAARLYNVDPDNALERTNKKFIKRFQYLEQETLAKGLSLHDMSLDEMNAIWEKAKQFDKQI
jgi:XTP/dITP diphosphohydrolase